MGAKQSKPQGQSLINPTINHPRFQNSKLIKNKENEDKLEVKVAVANETQFKQWVTNLKQIPIESQNFLIPESYEFIKEGFCGSTGFSTIVFPNFPFILTDQIENRKPKFYGSQDNSEHHNNDGGQKYFDEAELWYLVYSLIEAGHEFHSNGKKVGDVRPQNVFINQDGQVKVATQFTWPSQHTNYHKTFYEKQTTYLAPEELKDMIFAKLESSGDFRLAQSFSIGLTCLDAATLTSSIPLYQKNNKLNYEELSRRLQLLRNSRYSQVLNLVIANLCEADFERRSSCTELYNWLGPYQDSIISLEAFQVTTLPPKISNAIQSPRPIQNQVQNQNQGIPFDHRQGQQIINGSQIYGQQNYLPPVQGERVTYTQVVQPQQQRVILHPTQQQQQQHQQHHQQQQQQFPPNVTFAQYTSSQYHPGPSHPVGQTVTYSQPIYPGTVIRQDSSGDRPKTGMQLTLEKIDEQLQMSRRMFPS